MIKQGVGIDGYIQLFLQSKAYLLHLHPVVLNIRIGGNIQIFTQSHPDLMNLRRTHIVLQPFVNGQPAHDRQPDLLQVIIRESSLEIRDQINTRIE